jgi:steroid delta-isomerase-like uncharacterized protein
MVEDRNAEVVRAFCDAYNRRDVQAAMGTCADDCVAVYPTLARYAKDAWAGLLAEELEAFPDANIGITSLVAQGDKVAVEFDWKSTHKGTFRGVPPTQRAFNLPCMLLFDLRDGRISLVKYYWNTRLWDLHEQGS